LLRGIAAPDDGRQGHEALPFLQAAQLVAAFERAGNQHGQFRGIDVGADLVSSLPILGNRLHTIKPRTESRAIFRSQLWIAVVIFFAASGDPSAWAMAAFRVRSAVRDCV
jgi:hypothetical protein